jgi:hypothetical protein
MGTSRDAYDNQEKPSKEVSGSVPDKELRAIPCEIASLHAYSMDALIPGFYAWFGSVHIRIGGSEAEETYPGTIHSFASMAIGLPGYRIFSTYQGNYDP